MAFMGIQYSNQPLPLNPCMHISATSISFTDSDSCPSRINTMIHKQHTLNDSTINNSDLYPFTECSDLMSNFISCSIDKIGSAVCLSSSL